MTTKTTLELFKFGLLRVVSFLISMALMYVLHDQLRIEERLSYYLTLFILLLISYFISAFWIFHKQVNTKSFFKYFYYIGLVSLISVPVFEYLTNILELHYLVSTALSLGSVFILKFFLLKKNIFIEEVS